MPTARSIQKMCKKVLVALAAGGSIAITSITHAEPIRLSEPVYADEHSEVFGAQMLDADRTYSLNELLANGETVKGEKVVLQTQVGQVCQKKGCFLLATQGSTGIRVSFKDYGFFVPTDISGKEVTMTGELVEVERTDAQAEHFNEDVGQPDSSAASVLKAGVVYEFVAEAVRIPR